MPTFKNSLLVVFLIFSFIPEAMPQEKVRLTYSEGLASQKNFSPKQNVFLFGFIDEKSKVVIDYQFDTVFSAFNNGLAVVSKDGKAGVIDKKGKTIIPFYFREIGEISKEIVPVKDFRGMWGFYNLNGRRVTACKYDNFRLAGKGKIIVQEKGKWGIVSQEGKTIAHCIYKFITWTGGKNYQAVRLNQWTLTNFDNKELQKFEFDSIAFVDEHLLKYSVIGKYGLITLEGEVLTAPLFEDIRYYTHGLAVARKNDLYGVIDKKGDMVVPALYQDIIIDSLHVRVKKEMGDSRRERWGLYDHKGNQLIPAKFGDLKQPSNELVAATYDQRNWGYINLKGEKVIDFIYSECRNFHNGLATVALSNCGNCWAVINKNGEYVIRPENFHLYTFRLVRIDGLQNVFYKVPPTETADASLAAPGLIRLKRNGKFGIVDEEGRQIIPSIYDDIKGPSTDGLFVVKKNNKCAVLTKENRVVLGFNDYNNKFEDIFGFYDGYSKVLMKGKYGFINPQGKVLISPQYPQATDFSEGMAAVQIKGKWGFIDKNERLTVQPYYEDYKPFYNGIALVKENGKWNIVNKQGKELHSVSYDEIVLLRQGLYLLKLNDKLGMAAANGREVLPARFETIRVLDNGYVIVQKDGLWGVVDYQGNIVISINHERLNYDEAGNRLLLGNGLKPEHLKIK